MTATTPVQRSTHLTPDEVDEVLALAQAAGDTDGAYPLSEHVVLHVRHGGDRPAIHLYVREAGRLVGYAHVDTTDVIEGASAELVVHPMFRRHGLEVLALPLHRTGLFLPLLPLLAFWLKPNPEALQATDGVAPGMAVLLAPDDTKAMRINAATARTENTSPVNIPSRPT